MFANIYMEMEKQQIIISITKFTMIKRVFLFLLLWMSVANWTMAQGNCLTSKKYKISGIGNEYEVLPISMSLEILKGSVIVYASESSNVYLMGYRILDSFCGWSEDSILTSVSYKLLFKEYNEEKYPLMNLSFKNNKPDFFELLYPDSEKRRFYIRRE